MRLSTFLILSAVGCGVAGLAMRDPTPQIDAARDARSEAVAALTKRVETERAPSDEAASQRQVALTTHAPASRSPVSAKANAGGETAAPAIVAAPEAPEPVVDPKVARHHAWCDNRYKTYEVETATFQPYGDKPRKLCRSPIFRKGLRAG